MAIKKRSAIETLERVIEAEIDIVNKVIGFISALNEGGYFDHDSRGAIRDALYIFEKPWKWQNEMAEWECLGFPHAYNPVYLADLEIDTSESKILAYFSR